MSSQLSVPMTAQRSQSIESTGSSYMDCKSNLSSESEDEDMDYYYKGDSVRIFLLFLACLLVSNLNTLVVKFLGENSHQFLFIGHN